jgi:hypothetical protein
MSENTGESGDKPPARRVRDGTSKKGSGFRPHQHWNPCHGYKKPIMIEQPKFEGKCTDLKSFIYDCSDSRQADIFTKTTKEIAKYVGRTYRYGSDMRLAIEKLERPRLTLPTNPPGSVTKTETRIWEKEVDEYVKKKTYMEENLKTLYSLVWGQCTDVVRARIETLDIYDIMSSKRDWIGVLID